MKRCRQLEVFHGQQCVDQGGEGYSQVKPTAGQSSFAIRAWQCVCVCALYQPVCFYSQALFCVSVVSSYINNTEPQKYEP